MVLGIVDQQSRLGRPHGGQRRVVLTPEQVGGVLLDIPRVLWPFDSRDQGRVAGHRHGHGHPLVQGGEDDGLPAAARESGDGQALRIDPGMLFQVIESLPHGQVEEADGVGSHQVEMGSEPMRILGMGQLAAGQPFQIQRHHAPAGQADASLLLVFDGLAGASDVAVHVEDRWQGTPVSCRFVEERRDLETGQNLQEELSEAVALVLLRRIDLMETKRGLYPFSRPAAIDDVPEQLSAGVVRLSCPFFRTVGEWRQLWRTGQQVFAEQVVKQSWFQGLPFQEGCELAAGALGLQ